MEDWNFLNHSVQNELQMEQLYDSLENINPDSDECDEENENKLFENNHFNPINSGSAFTVNFDPMNGENNENNCLFYPNNHYDIDGNTKFKLPPRIAARLYKKRSPKILQNLENVQQQNEPLIRRETIVIRSKKSKNLFDQKAQDVLSTQENIKNIKNQTIIIDNVEEDSRYVNWINSVIATSFKIENITVDTARIINDCIMSESTNIKNSNSSTNINKNSNIPLKDGITSIAYREEKLMDILREKAIQLYESDEMKLVKEVLLEDLRIPRYYIRNDRSIHADVGSKKHILEILLNYNPLWLKVALETIFEQKINKTTRNEVHTLVHFLTQRLLSFKTLAIKKNYKNVTTYFMNENNVKQAKQHILYHFLMIVHFLDVAKRKRLIDHDPCLFRTDAICKSSRAVVLLFTRDYITGVGDITRSLRNVGIHLEYIQNPIEEFNFTVTKLSSDLRCGVRLARLLEIILSRNDILPRLYFPANNITRKIHNMEQVFKMLKPLLVNFDKSITPKDIRTGVRQKTIILLDSLIKIYNIHLREIELKQSIGNVIKIQKTFRRYLECRTQRKYFLQLKFSVILVQRKYRSKIQNKKIRNEFLKLRYAAIFIQQKFRANKLMKFHRAHYLQLKNSVIFIQRRFRTNQIAKLEHKKYLKMKQSALIIQRNWLIYRRQQELKKVAIIIQKRFRAKLEMKRCRTQYQLMRQNAIKIQRIYRSLILTREYRNKFLKMKYSAIMIQKTWRGYHRQKLYLQLKQSVIVTQNRFRANQQMKQQREYFQQLKQVTIFIQRQFRQNRQFKIYYQQYRLMRSSAIIIQRAYRTLLQRRSFLKLCRATIFIQTRFRAKLKGRFERERYLKFKNAVVIIQRKWREELKLKKLTKAAIIIQQRFRAKQDMQKSRYEYLKILKATRILQNRFRALLIGREQQKHFGKMKKSAIKIQRFYRERKRTNDFKNIVSLYVSKVKSSAIIIQKYWRGYRVRKTLDAQTPSFEIIREQLAYVNKNITEEKKLINVIIRTIERISKSNSIDQLHQDIEKIEKGTTLSLLICRILVEHEWFIRKLLLAFKALNRSEPHKKIIAHILSIFINILQKTNCRFLYFNGEVLDILIKILRNFPKSNHILSRNLKILFILLQDNRTLRLFKEDKHWIMTLETFLKKNVPVIHSKSNDSPKLMRRHYSTSQLIQNKSTILSKRDNNSLTTISLKLSKMIF